MRSKNMVILLLPVLKKTTGQIHEKNRGRRRKGSLTYLHVHFCKQSNCAVTNVENENKFLTSLFD